MVKAIFFDVDGTLLSHTSGDVPLSARKSLRKLQAKGIKIFVATGRHLAELNDFPIREIQFDGYITLNGQLVLDSDKKLLYGVPFSKEITNSLADLYAAKEIPLVLVEESRISINFANDLVRQVQQEVSTSVPQISDFDGLPVYQATTFFRRGEEALLDGKLPDGCKLARWSSGGVDIIAQTGGKIEGIKKLLDYHHISRNETMAFGDAENDIEMLLYAQIGIAMGNAVDCVKTIADYVTDSIDCDGIEKALTHYQML